ncbi:putative methyltransferase C9orf114 -like [Scophthalmus maximus]|uniref:28S rRNA (uridine-N(3))-methyltransferase n=1 Tax=Scophthalmus maximus TaxID=52904 RepID=A0A2U9CL83_SCOMX|nr:putative methyltransferase C9orf114 -like [Scophthalmus maximus]
MNKGKMLRVLKGNLMVLGRKDTLVFSSPEYCSILNVHSESLRIIFRSPLFANMIRWGLNCFSYSNRYLRKWFFPKHQDLQYAGLLNPLDSPHHMRIDEESDYREGIVLDRPTKQGQGSLVNCGMRKDVRIDKQLQSGLRVTVQLNETQKQESRIYKGVVVAPHVPRTEGGLYWGYTVRLASCLSAVFTESPYKEGYDLTVGTSEKGSNMDQTTLTPFKHLLVVFGGLQGLEASVDADQNLDVTDPSVLFDIYLDTCPGQGSRTIRTEEAILISMAGLRQKITTAFSEVSTGSSSN